MSTIQQTSIAKITIKKTGYVFYQVKSDSTNEYYQLHLGADGQYHCNCPSHKPCKHERALNEILEAQVAQLFASGEAAFPELVCPQVLCEPIFEVPATLPHAPVSHPPIDHPRQMGTLNGNRGFSLLRR